MRPHREVQSRRTAKMASSYVGIGKDQHVDANEFFEISFHATHGDVHRSSHDDIDGWKLFPGAILGYDFHVLREITQMIHGHGD